MSGRRGSHNRKSNTYVTSSRSDTILSPPNKKVNTLESYFVSKYKSSTTESQPLSPVESNQSSVTSAQTEEVPSASQSPSPSPIQLDECSANTIPTEDVLSAPTSSTPEIESEKASDSESEVNYQLKPQALLSLQIGKMIGNLHLP